MYACDNCGGTVGEPSGRCATCHIRLHDGNVSPLHATSAPADLAISHRCGNCGDTLVNSGGKCRACRYPIPTHQLAHVPGAAIRSLREDPTRRRAS